MTFGMGYLPPSKKALSQQASRGEPAAGEQTADTRKRRVDRDTQNDSEYGQKHRREELDKKNTTSQPQRHRARSVRPQSNRDTEILHHLRERVALCPRAALTTRGNRPAARIRTDTNRGITTTMTPIGQRHLEHVLPGGTHAVAVSHHPTRERHTQNQRRVLDPTEAPQLILGGDTMKPTCALEHRGRVIVTFLTDRQGGNRVVTRGPVTAMKWGQRETTVHAHQARQLECLERRSKRFDAHGKTRKAKTCTATNIRVTVRTDSVSGQRRCGLTHQRVRRRYDA